MGNVPIRDEKRDQELIADYIKHTNGKFKFSVTQVAVKYEMTAARLYQILDFYKVPRRTKQNS